MAKSGKQRDKDTEQLANAVKLAVILVCLMIFAKTRDMSAVIVALLVILVCVIAAISLLRIARVAKRARTTIADLDGGTWEEFESYLVAMFRARGYRAELTPNGRDFGADLTLSRNGEKTVVQAKHWQKRDVGVKAVQEVLASMAH